MDRKAAIESAILRLKPEGFTADGKPSVKAINHHVAPDGFDPITASERDALWAERVAEAEDAGAMSAAVAFDEVDDAPEGMVAITITAASSDPMSLYVHGVGSWSIRVGETCALPVEAVAALRNSDCIFTQE